MASSMENILAIKNIVSQNSMGTATAFTGQGSSSAVTDDLFKAGLTTDPYAKVQSPGEGSNINNQEYLNGGGLESTKTPQTEISGTVEAAPQEQFFQTGNYYTENLNEAIFQIKLLGEPGKDIFTQIQEQQDRERRLRIELDNMAYAYAENRDESINTEYKRLYEEHMEVLKWLDTYVPMAQEAYGAYGKAQQLYDSYYTVSNINALMNATTDEAVKKQLRADLEIAKRYEYEKLSLKDDFEEKAALGGYMPQDYYDMLSYGRYDEAREVYGEITQSQINWLENFYGEVSGRDNYDVNYMTETERKIYAYLLATQSRDAADEYYDLIKGELVARHGNKIAAEAESKNPITRMLVTAGRNFVSGIEDWESGLYSLITGQEDTPSANQYASQVLAQNSGGILPYIYGGTRSIGRMLPSIIMGKFAGGLSGASNANMMASLVSSGTVAASTAGTAYSQALAEGWDKDKAMTYGLGVGLSEGLLQYLVGGLTSLCGVSDDVLLEWAKTLDGTFARLATQGLIKVGWEIGEELAQAYIEPALASAVFGIDYKTPSGRERLDIIMTTIFTVMAMETGNLAETEINMKKHGRDILNYHTAAELLDAAKTMNESSAAYKMAQKMNSEKMTATDVSRLYTQMYADGWIDPMYLSTEQELSAENTDAETSAGNEAQNTAVSNEMTNREVQKPAISEETIESEEQNTTDSKEAPESEEQKNIVSEETTGNTRLTESDLQDYMHTGDRQHVRNQKNSIQVQGKSPILTKAHEIADFIRKAFSGKIRDEIRAYGKVGTAFANRVRAASNGSVQIDGYYLELDSNKIAHLSDHVETDDDPRNIPLTMEQIEQLPEYIDNFDDLLDIIQRKDGSVRLKLGKKINGHSIIIEAVSKGRKALHPVTAYQVNTDYYNQYYKTKVAGRSSTSQSAKTDHVDISQPAATFASSIPHSAENIKGENVAEVTGAEQILQLREQVKTQEAELEQLDKVLFQAAMDAEAHANSADAHLYDRKLTEAQTAWDAKAAELEETQRNLAELEETQQNLPETEETMQSPEVDTSELSKYNADRVERYSGEVTPELVQSYENALTSIPEKHLVLAESIISGIEITDSNTKCSFNTKTGLIKVSRNASPRGIIHEYAHAIAEALGVYDDPRFLAVLHKGLENITVDDIIMDEDSFSEPIWRVECDKFVSPYQGRLYEKYGIFNGKELSFVGMRDYFSVGYEEYLNNPENLKKHDPELFAYMEGLL